MKTSGILLMMSILSLILSACGAAPNSAKTAIDLKTLPTNIDVKTVAVIKDLPEVVVLDVREPFEFAEGHIPGVKLIPVDEVSSRLNEIPKDKTVVVTCRSGNRSDQVTAYLQSRGYTRVHNMVGGILAWQRAGFKVEK